MVEARGSPIGHFVSEKSIAWFVVFGGRSKNTAKRKRRYVGLTETAIQI